MSIPTRLTAIESNNVIFEIDGTEIEEYLNSDSKRVPDIREKIRSRAMCLIGTICTDRPNFFIKQVELYTITAKGYYDHYNDNVNFYITATVHLEETDAALQRRIDVYNSKQISKEEKERIRAAKSKQKKLERMLKLEEELKKLKNEVNVQNKTVAVDHPSDLESQLLEILQQKEQS